jgi:hypothetical protein
MDNPEKLATLCAQDRGRRQTQYKSRHRKLQKASEKTEEKDYPEKIATLDHKFCWKYQCNRYMLSALLRLGDYDAVKTALGISRLM